MKTPDGGLVATLYSPCDVQTKVNSTPIRIVVATDYPFKNSVRATITPDKPMRFPVSFRIPAWATGSTVQLNGHPLDVPTAPGTYARIDREWKSGDVIELKFPMQPRISRWYAQSIALERGPLVYSLDLGGSWLKLRDRGMTADWQVFPTRAWNYALLVNEKNVRDLEITEQEIGARPFASSHPPVQLHVQAKKLNEWLSEDGVAEPVPQSPVRSIEKEEALMLIPYGAAKLRVTAFPEVET